MFYGRVLERRRRAMIRGWFWPRPFAVVFIYVWFSGILYAGWVGIRQNTPVLLVVAALLATLGVVIVRQCIVMSAQGEREVVAFLRTLIEAPVNTGRHAV
jgi:hypothetical protein